MATKKKKVVKKKVNKNWSKLVPVKKRSPLKREPIQLSQNDKLAIHKAAKSRLVDILRSHSNSLVPWNSGALQHDRILTPDEMLKRDDLLEKYAKVVAKRCETGIRDSIKSLDYEVQLGI